MSFEQNENDFIEYRKEKDSDKINTIRKPKKNNPKVIINKSKTIINTKKCNCEGFTHDIIANCIKCGKLYCSFNDEITCCEFCSGFVADPRSSIYKSWFEEQMKIPEFAKAIEIRDRMIEHET